MTRGYFNLLAMFCILGVVVRIHAQDKNNLLGMPHKAVATGGYVMLCGGGELPDEIYDEFVRISGGRRARIVLIPSAHPYDSQQQLMNRFSGWNDYDVLSFDFLDTDDPEESDDADFVAPLERATGVWIAGGAQARLLQRYGGRKVESALRRVIDRGGIVAGDSAGAAVLSRVVIRGGTSSEALLDKGFGLIDRAIIDCHFTQRARHTRLLNIIEEHPEVIGIGVDETSALIVRQDRLRVLGNARATVMISRGGNRSVVVHQLRSGDEAEITLVGSPFESGAPTTELLHRPKPLDFPAAVQGLEDPARPRSVPRGN